LHQPVAQMLSIMLLPDVGTPKYGITVYCIITIVFTVSPPVLPCSACVRNKLVVLHSSRLLPYIII
jgi:hypothetical protein